MGQRESGGRSDRSRRTGRATGRQVEKRRQAERKTEKGEDSSLLVRHRSVVLQGAHGALPRGVSRDRSRSRALLVRGWLVWGRPGRDPFALRIAVESFVPFAGNLWLSWISFQLWSFNLVLTIRHLGGGGYKSIIQFRAYIYAWEVFCYLVCVYVYHVYLVLRKEADHVHSLAFVDSSAELALVTNRFLSPE